MSFAVYPTGGGGSGPSSSSAAAASTASGYLALLQEEDPSLREYALNKLLGIVDTHWHEVAEALPLLEEWSEGDEGSDALKRTSAAVASRVFFHLEEPTQALRLALQAGPQYFDVSKEREQSPYEERLVAAALDAYVKAKAPSDEDEEEEQRQAKDGGEGGAPSDAAALPVDQLESMVFRLMDNCCETERWDWAIAMALEARQGDRLEQILARADDFTWIRYTLDAALKSVSNKAFRQQVLQVIARSLEGLEKKQYYYLVLVYQRLGQPQNVANVLTTLLTSAEKDEQLLGLQIGFDLMDSGDQAFAKKVAAKLFPDDPENGGGAAAGSAGGEAAPSTSTGTALEQAKRVLLGGFPSELALSFLHKQSKADRLIMEQLKKALEERSSGSRSSILHNTAVVTHSYLYAGTTNDSFLRDYLDWMKKASNW